MSYSALREQLLLHDLELPEKHAPVYELLGRVFLRLVEEREAERAEVAALRREVAALRREAAEYRQQAVKVLTEAEHLARRRAELLGWLRRREDALRAAGRAGRLERRRQRDRTRRAQEAALRAREASERVRAAAELAAHRSALVGLLWSRVELPAIPTLPERIAYLLRQPLRPGEDRTSLRDLRRVTGSPTLLRVRAAATAVSAPPRWLAFGECLPGDDAEGVGARIEAARAAAGLSRKDLAHRAGLSASMVHMLALGYVTTGTRKGIRKEGPGRRLTASLETVRKLADALGVSPGWLAYGDPSD